MSVTTIRNKIKSIAEEVENSGKVYAYYRYADTLDKLLKLFKVNNNIRGMMISPRTRKTDITSELGIVRNWDLFLLSQVNDKEQSEIKFDELIESIVEKFDEHQDLDGEISEHTGIQLENKTEREYGNVVCHVAVLTLETTE